MSSHLRMFNRILIANRGEIAVRLIRACHEMGIAAVAVYSEADRSALHVRLADQAVPIGPSPASESYLRTDHLIEAALSTGCEAIHPGYGFLSESPDFADAVVEAELAFIGPPADAIRAMGVKIEARRIMQAAEVPVVPGFQNKTATDDGFIREAATIGYPIMVKASGGGGGKGIRIVRDPDSLPDALSSARREAEHAFGDPTLFLEKYIEQGRHIEFQIMADAHGNVVHLFERECSIQRRHQKIVEETPSPLLSPELRSQMGRAAVNAARAIGYVNAGTVEFIADRDGHFYFLEMNTRLQVEHPITELVAGIDLVQLQIRVAAGEPLPFNQSDLTQRGHAIECRVYAEDPSSGFLPSTGTVLLTEEPAGPGIRVDSGVDSGDEVSLFYDPMIAKVIVNAATRDEAIRRMCFALQQYVIVGPRTNLLFLQAVLNHPVFLSGEADTHFVDAHLTDWKEPIPELPPEALIAAAIGEIMQKQGVSEEPASHSDGDIYSPWSRADNFRMSIDRKASNASTDSGI